MSWFSSIIDYVSEKIDDIKDYLFGEPEQEEEENLFGEVDTLSPNDTLAEYEEVYSILAEAEAEAEAEETDETDETEPPEINLPEPEPYHNPYDTQLEIDIHSFPEFVDAETIAQIENDLGITDYNDLSENEKDSYIIGWRGFELADEPADYIRDSDFEAYKYDISQGLGIEQEITNNLEQEDLDALNLITANSSDIRMNMIFAELEPEEYAKEAEQEYRGTFESWESLLNSGLWDFIKERPELFDIDFYTDDEGEFYIDIYERRS